MQNKKTIIIFISIALFLGIALYFSKEKISSLYSEPATIDGLQEIEFEKSLMFQLRSYLVDGKKKVKFNCSIEGTYLGFIRWGDEVAKIICIDDYLGGVKLIYNVGEKNSEANYPIELAQRDGDAGDSWDMRGVINKQDDQPLRIEVLNLMSTMDIEDIGKQEIFCRSFYTTLVWSQKSDKFVKSKDSKALVTAKSFDPPTKLLKDCSDKNGEWLDGPSLANQTKKQ